MVPKLGREDVWLSRPAAGEGTIRPNSAPKWPPIPGKAFFDQGSFGKVVQKIFVIPGKQKVKSLKQLEKICWSLWGLEPSAKSKELKRQENARVVFP